MDVNAENFVSDIISKEISFVVKISPVIGYNTTNIPDIFKLLTLL